VNFAPSQVNIIPVTAPNFAARPVDRSPHRLATGILLLYLFLLVSRGIELLAGVLGVNLRLMLILMLVSVATAVLTGGLLEAVKTPVVVMFTAFTGWFLLTTLSSQWRGGSVMMLVNFWIPSYACVLLIPSLISSLDQCRKACYVMAFSLFPILLAAVLFQSQVGGRDQTQFGTLGNPNDLAFSLLLLIPFAVLVIKSESRRSWKTIACLLLILFALLKTVKTGSRAGLVTMAVCLVILFFGGKMATKLKIVGLVVSFLAIAAVTIPSQTLQRYTTIFNGTSVDADMSIDQFSAVQSTQARKMLLQESIRLMLEHPLFGVGPGIFSAALAGDQKNRGQQESWHEAHNSYTQIGSEMGIPGFLIYVTVLVYSMKRAISIYQATRKDPARIAISRMAASLFMALVIYAIFATFGNYSYSYYFPVLAGLVQSFDLCVRKEMNTTQSMVPTSLPTRLAASTPNPQVPTYVRNRRLRHDRA
jgi:O-antigen ligase